MSVGILPPKHSHANLSLRAMPAWLDCCHCHMNFRKNRWLTALALAWLSLGAPSRAAETKPTANFQELYSLIRSNLVGLSPEDLNRAATLGLVDQLRGRVELLGGPTDTNAATDRLVASTNLFDDAYGYIRIGTVSQGLGEQFGKDLKQLQAIRPLKGLILDLRFAAGTDFKAAIDVVDYFAATEQLLLKWGGQTGRTQAKSDPIKTPLAVLINPQTVGAAEALAGMLRIAGLAYLVGSPTAGQARTYHEFTLTNGQKLRIGQNPVELGNGEIISDKGVAPDLLVESTLAAERNYIIDPFSVLTRPLTNSIAQPAPRRTLNEAELVRRHKDGVDPDAPQPIDLKDSKNAPKKTAIIDPSLGRALDFLKGLAILQTKPD